MTKKKVFISGGSGVIGQELVRILEKKNYIIFVGDIKPKPKNFSNKIKYFQGDLNFINEEIIKEFKPNVFIHLAATFERSDENYTFWEENHQHNVKLSHHLMTIMKDIQSLKRVIFASSYLVYDPKLYLSKNIINRNSSLEETDNLNPRNLTGMAKLSHENELGFINNFKNKKFSTVMVRIFRGYGKNSRDIISRWIRSLINNEKISVYGQQGQFDFIYSKDTALGISKLIEKNSVVGPINLGTGKSRSISEVLDIIKGHFQNPKIEFKKKQMLYESSSANMNRFINELNWSPVYTLESAIPEIIEYEKNKEKETREFQPFNILITSSSKKIPLIESCLEATKKFEHDINVICGDSRRNILSKYVFKNFFWKMPIINELNLKKVIEGCKKRNIKIIIPTRDGELYFWAKNIEIFKKNDIEIIISPLKSVNICNDKLSFSEYFSNRSVGVIESEVNINSIKNAKKYVVKERFGSSSKTIGVNINKSTALKISKKLEHPLFQPYIEGTEISVDAWFSKDFKLVGFNMRKRELIENGESKVTSNFKNKHIEKKFELFFRHLKFRGPVIAQAIMNKNNLFIIECNPRFGGASTASIYTGLDIFYWSILEILEPKTKQIKYNSVKKRIRQARIEKDIVV